MQYSEKQVREILGIFRRYNEGAVVHDGHELRLFCRQILPELKRYPDIFGDEISHIESSGLVQ